MQPIKVLSIFGTRPEAIKMLPVVKLMEQDEHFKSIVCITAQHRQMLDQVMSLFNISADYDLDVMAPNQSLTGLTTKILQKLDPVIAEVQPDWILVQGDTTSCFVGSLCAFYHKIKVGHVEAGLRTGDLFAPFPEEGNRLLTSKLANLHFAPTKQAEINLIAENISDQFISVTGNTVIDALAIVSSKSQCKPEWDELFNSASDVIEQKQEYVMVTGHRRENFGQGFLNICQALKALALKYPEWHFIYPVHLNPNVQKPVNELLKGIHNIHLISPLDYEPFVYLMMNATIVLTDSGGVQEEAPYFGKPVLVMRDKTERPEGVEAGTAKLVGTNSQNIINEVSALIDSPEVYQKMAHAVNPYGDGHASSRILNQLYNYDQCPK